MSTLNGARHSVCRSALYVFVVFLNDLDAVCWHILAHTGIILHYACQACSSLLRHFRFGRDSADALVPCDRRSFPDSQPEAGPRVSGVQVCSRAWEATAQNLC